LKRPRSTIAGILFSNLYWLMSVLLQPSTWSYLLGDLCVWVTTITHSLSLVICWPGKHII
jgi:hypothetical protein